MYEEWQWNQMLQIYVYLAPTLLHCEGALYLLQLLKNHLNYCIRIG